MYMYISVLLIKLDLALEQEDDSGSASIRSEKTSMATSKT